jgi:hypothetical protein
MQTYKTLNVKPETYEAVLRAKGDLQSVTVSRCLTIDDTVAIAVSHIYDQHDGDSNGKCLQK